MISSLEITVCSESILHRSEKSSFVNFYFMFHYRLQLEEGVETLERVSIMVVAMEVTIMVMMMITLMNSMMVMREMMMDFLGVGCFSQRYENLIFLFMYFIVMVSRSNGIYVIVQIFDRKFVDAVLNEWQKTMMDLPAGLRQAYEMVRHRLSFLLL